VIYSEYTDAVAREIEDLSAALAAGPLSDPVPTCSDWAVADLAVHVGEFCGFWSHVLCEGTGRPKTPFTDPPRGDALAGWAAELGVHLVAELEATPSETEVWTWLDADKSAGFVGRRCAHELAVHRYDAQSARGTCSPIAPRLAADGIAEILDALLSLRDRTGQGSGQSMHLHGTDAREEAEWVITFHADRVDARQGHAKADLALRGSVSDLELLLYGRPTLGEVEHLGDESVLELWYREFAF
jgi:hypothetical protein